MRTKNEFRAIRERVGMTQALLARKMGVSQRSVRYWEDPDSMRKPPEEAWQILDDALELQRMGLSNAVRIADDPMFKDGNLSVRLPYWLSESQYEEFSTDAAYGICGDWRMANANNMALAIRLEERGMRVEWIGGNPARPEGLKLVE